MTTTTAGPTAPLSTVVRPPPDRLAPRLIGGLFLAGFLTYGTGSLLMTSVTGGPDIVAEVVAHRSLLVLGAVLMLLNTAVDIGKAVLFFPILEPHGRRTALTYLATMVFEVAIMAVGILCLLALVPLAGQVDAGQLGAGQARAFAVIATDTGELAYQIGQAGLAFGAFFLCLLLYRTGMIPRFLAAWGAVGYVLHFAGAVAELFGSHVSYVLLIPGGLFEVALAGWLIVRGLRTVTP